MTADRKRVYHKRDRLRQLRAFCQASRTGSISRAAESLGLKLPAVSLHVRELEYELEAVLFERRGSRISLTAAGERLLEIVGPLVDAMDGISDVITERGDQPVSGDLHIAAGPTGVPFVLPPLFKRFRDEYPEVRLRVRNSLVEDGFRLLMENRVELLTGPRWELNEEELCYHPVFSDELVLVTSPDHPLAGRDSIDFEGPFDHPVVMPAAGTYDSKFREFMEHRLGAQAEVAIEVDGWSPIKRYVEEGLGVSVVPRLCITEHDRLSVIPLEGDRETRSYGVFTRRGRLLSRPAEQFVRLMAPDFPFPGSGSGPRGGRGEPSSPSSRGGHGRATRARDPGTDGRGRRSPRAGRHGRGG